MALTIGQIVAVAYPAVLTEMRKAANQWAESAFMREMERQGAVERKSLGATIEAPLDYRRNTGTQILPFDLQPLSMVKTEVITSASYDPAEISAPIIWSKRDEVQTPTENQKIVFVKSLLENAIQSHDDIIEEALFAVSTNGLLGIRTHTVDAGTGSDGGIDSSVETWWKNKEATYVDDTDIEAAFTTLWNACSKGSGSKLSPTMMVSDGATQALFEGSQQAQQRYIDEQELKAGFKILGFKTARYVFSQYGGTRVHFLNPQSFKLVVSKEYFRDRSDTQELQNANGFVSKIYSAGQTVTNNRSRLGVAHL